MVQFVPFNDIAVVFAPLGIATKTESPNATPTQEADVGIVLAVDVNPGAGLDVISLNIGVPGINP